MFNTHPVQWHEVLIKKSYFYRIILCLYIEHIKIFFTHWFLRIFTIPRKTQSPPSIDTHVTHTHIRSVYLFIYLLLLTHRKETPSNILHYIIRTVWVEKQTRNKRNYRIRYSLMWAGGRWCVCIRNYYAKKCTSCYILIPPYWVDWSFWVVRTFFLLSLSCFCYYDDGHEQECSTN